MIAKATQLARGLVSNASVSLEGATITMKDAYPTATAIASALGDYTGFTPSVSGTVTTFTVTGRSNCYITYTEASGTTGRRGGRPRIVRLLSRRPVAPGVGIGLDTTPVLFPRCYLGFARLRGESSRWPREGRAVMRLGFVSALLIGAIAASLFFVGFNIEIFSVALLLLAALFAAAWSGYGSGWSVPLTRLTWALSLYWVWLAFIALAWSPVPVISTVTFCG